MKTRSKVGVVAAGYLAAFVLASVVVAFHIADTSGPESQDAGGMYAAGDAFLFVFVVGVAGLVPTGVALFFLRRNRAFWMTLSMVGIAIALTGVAAAALFAFGQNAAAPSALSTLADVSVLRILVSPLFALVFLLAGVLSAYPGSRLALLGATALEAIVSGYGGFVWFIPLYFQAH